MIDAWGVGLDLLERMGLLAAARRRGYVIDRLEFAARRWRAPCSLTA